jgi:hypothetical protein
MTRQPLQVSAGSATWTFEVSAGLVRIATPQISVTELPHICNSELIDLRDSGRYE